MVYGDVNVSAVEFVPGENAGDIADKLEKLVSTHKEEEWLIAVDLQCGSPWNAAAGLAMRNPRLGSSAACRYRWLWSWWITSKR
jgi:PTS system sorbose-specific IIA component